MAQPLLLDPTVSSGPTLVGTGDGTLTVNRLTHFTIAQTYVVTCISKSPDTVFAVVGSLDGSVGLATTGVQFFDGDLKIFLTIEQGATAFEVGDEFTLAVVNGTDLDQDNIDDYDEQAQKNFGAGVKGTLSGDHSVRYSNTDLAARLYIQDLLYIAAVAGTAGNLVQIEYLTPVAPISSTLVEQDLTFTSLLYGASGDAITIEYEDGPTPIAATGNATITSFANLVSGSADTVEVAGVVFTAQAGAVTPGDPTFQAATTNDATAISLAAQINAHATTSPLVTAGAATNVVTIDADVAGSGGNSLSLAYTDNDTNVGATVSGATLTGGDFGAGDESVGLISNAIFVTMASALSTADTIKAAIAAFGAAAALVTTTVSGTGSNTQTGPIGPTNLAGGTDGIGDLMPDLIVTSNLIQIHFDAGVHTASQVKTEFDLVGAATALASVTIHGNGANPQFSPHAAENLDGGLEKQFSLNQNEITDAGNFAEGNANILAQSAVVQGNALVSGHASVDGTLSLANTGSGPKIGNVQQAINRLIEQGKMTLNTVSQSSALYLAGSMTISTDLKITFQDTGMVNTITAAVFALSDGESLYVELNPIENATLATTIASSVPTTPNSFRICTRVGASLVWFNNFVQNDGDYAKVGGAPSYTNNLLDLMTGGGNISHDNSTAGLITWDADFILKQLGLSAAVTVTANNVTLADGEVGYIQLDDPIATGTKAVLTADVATIDLRRPDRYWLFYRKGAVVHIRRSDVVLAQGEDTDSLGGGGGLVKADYLEAVVTTLPTGTSVTLDGSAGVNGDKVLFTKLASNNNRVYELSGVGSSLVWTALTLFEGALDPTSGDLVSVASGTAFSTQIAKFNGTNWHVNETIRQFDGVSPNFIEEDYLDSIAMIGSQTDTVIAALTFAHATYEAVEILYKLKEAVSGDIKMGILLVVSNGTDVAITDTGAETADTGITFDAAVNGANIEISYSSGANGATMRAAVKRIRA